jgi:ADP-heptose:LPS heptosyltransferase
VNVATIRWIELWLGRPLCALLTLHRRVVESLARPGAQSPVRRVMFIKLIEQGSTVLAHHALTRAVERVGRSNVFYCAFAENREIVDIMNVIPADNVLTLRAHRLDLLIRDGLAVLARARAIDIDATVDLEFFARAPAILAYLSGARRRAGLHRFTSEAPYRGDLMTHRVQYNPYLHTASTFDLLVESLWRDPAELPLSKVAPPAPPAAPPRFAPSEAEKNAAVAIVEREAGRPIGGRLVVLNTNAHDRLPLRKWPAERFVELGRRILADYPDVSLLLTGTGSERAAAEEARHAIGPERTVNLAGRTTLREALVVFGLSDLLVTNDSGPAHFATLSGTRVIVLFGPETPRLYGPPGDRARVHWAGIACSPCVNASNHRLSPCDDNVCMHAIEVEDVYRSVRDFLDAAGAAASDVRPARP